jgi:hypothetical protein
MEYKYQFGLSTPEVSHKKIHEFFNRLYKSAMHSLATIKDINDCEGTIRISMEISTNDELLADKFRLDNNK